MAVAHVSTLDLEKDVVNFELGNASPGEEKDSEKGREEDSPALRALKAAQFF